MHMGHSHSHHHHHHEEEHNKPLTTPPKTLSGKALRFSQRPVVRLAFSFLVVFVPALLRNQRRQLPIAQVLTRADFAAFFAICAALSFADGVRKEAKRFLHRVMDWKDGIVKHAPREKPRSLVERLFSKSREHSADQVTLVGVLINIFLSVGKLIIGVFCHSSALIADAGHSLSDLFSDFVTLWAVQIARLPPDEDHPYGHGKFEAIGALFLALILLGTGLSVGAVSNGKLLEIIRLQRTTGGVAAVAAQVKIPTFPALIMAFASIVSKEWLYRVTRRVGEDLNSQVVIANAYHHRSDAYSSILALVSIALAMLVPGLIAADSAAGLLVGGMICMTGAEIMGEAVKQLTDSSADESLVANVKRLALQESADVLDVTRIRTRQMGSKAFVDVTISTPESLSKSATRAVEERVKYAILKNERNVIDADVHSKTRSTTTTESEPYVDGHEAHSHDHSHGPKSDSDGSQQVAGMSSRQAGESVKASSNDESGVLIAASQFADETAGPLQSSGPPASTISIGSFQQIEDDARHLLKNHASIRSIEGCTVHYDEASQEVQVDVTIKLESPEWTTVRSAQVLARQLKGILEGEASTNIHKANIFLDLNAYDSDAVDTPSLIYYLTETKSRNTTVSVSN
jgi:cation diffusion facilitator family transporter